MRRRWAVAIGVRHGDPLTYGIKRRYWTRRAAQRQVNRWERVPNPLYRSFVVRLEA